MNTYLKDRGIIRIVKPPNTYIVLLHPIKMKYLLLKRVSEELALLAIVPNFLKAFIVMLKSEMIREFRICANEEKGYFFDTTML